MDGPDYDRAMGIRWPPVRRLAHQRWPTPKRAFRRTRGLFTWILLGAGFAYLIPLAVHLAAQAPIAIAHRMTVDDYRALAACPKQVADVVRLVTRDDFEAEGSVLVHQFCEEAAFGLTDAPGVRSRPTQATAPRYEIAELERLVHDLVNLKRTQAGLPALARDDALSAVARGHSLDMAQRGYFEHATPEGFTPSDRAAEAGYGCRKDYDTFYTEGVAENVYSGWLYGSTTYFGPLGVNDYLTPHAIANGAADAWMDSPDHRENILGPRYDRVGTGVAVSEEESVLITQNFC